MANDMTLYNNTSVGSRAVCQVCDILVHNFSDLRPNKNLTRNSKATLRQRCGWEGFGTRTQQTDTALSRQYLSRLLFWLHTQKGRGERLKKYVG